MAIDYERTDRTPIPPADAKVYTTACDYCIVGCGYKAYVWPDGTEGGPMADQNAFGIDFPVPALSGHWVSPNQHNYCLVEGKKHHVVVKPDADATVVNRGGNHSIRGGCIAQKVYNPDGPTKDRLKHPLLRVNGELTPVSWDLALDIMADVSKHVIDTFGEAAWGMKTHSYQYFENTYAISKLAFESVQTPAYAPHDKPGPGSDTAGVDDAGIITFSASNYDWSIADVIFISGTDPWETKTVLFTEWMMKGHPNKIIMVLPRKTTGAVYAEQNGGLFLSIIPGTDAILHMALIRLILENGWEDKEFIDTWIANRWEIDSGFGRGTRNTPWQWRTTWGKLGASYTEYRDWILSEPRAELSAAAEMTGIPAEKIREAAEILAKPVNGRRPKTSFALEKGNYWSNNYLNTTSFSSLGLICGAGNRPGQVISRLGGHQRGWYAAAGYPRIFSPEKQAGRRKKEIDLDRWVEGGHLRFAYVIGTTWCQAMAASHELMSSFRRMTRENPHQITEASRDAAVTVLKRRVNEGGMVIVHQDIYLREPIASEFADIVLPAATWGECDLTRCNGERRLRLYSKFCDPPAEAQPDWWIIARFARKMGFKDYDWKDSNDVFEQAARFGRGGVLNYHPLVVYAKQLGLRAHELLRRLGTHGIQTPIRYRTQFQEPEEYLEYAGYYTDPSVPGGIVGTKRLHDLELKFGEPEGPTVHKK
ncbi:MAG: arsenate reductase (azurin) large subunit, partial [Candidatus Hydrogenedentes bacterium]|nr:arsenate reductase (azurin) large subunit [Candidatus Hydrogenedentota bacterium]